MTKTQSLPWLFICLNSLANSRVGAGKEETTFGDYFLVYMNCIYFFIICCNVLGYTCDQFSYRDEF